MTKTLALLDGPGPRARGSGDRVGAIGARREQRVPAGKLVLRGSPSRAGACRRKPVAACNRCRIPTDAADPAASARRGRRRPLASAARAARRRVSALRRRSWSAAPRRRRRTSTRRRAPRQSRARGSGGSTFTSRARPSATARGQRELGRPRRGPPLQAEPVLRLRDRSRFRRRPRLQTTTSATRRRSPFNGLFFLNPRSRAQIYLLAGFGWSGAHSQSDPSTASGDASFDQHYSYFGGQAGVGLELRLTRVLALQRRRPRLRPHAHRRARADPARVHELAGAVDEHVGRRPAHRRDDALLLEIAWRKAGSPRRRSGRARLEGWRASFAR